jgi:RND family efflux transporter MFP subunit
MSGGKGDLSALRIADSARTGDGAGRTLRLLAGGLVLLLIVVGLAYALRSRPSLVEVATARAAVSGSNGPALLNASGYVTPRGRATVAAKITGRVSDVLIDEGMPVSAGQILATLDDSDARSRLASAEAQRDVAQASIKDYEVNLANAERDLKRTADLQGDGGASVQMLDQARTTVESLRARIALAKEQVKAAEAAIAVAQRDLDNCTVRAPFAGIVVSKDAQRGEIVSPISAGGGFTRTGIATVVDMQSLEIEVDVNESHIAKVTPGQRVEATLNAYPDWRIPAKVRTVIPTADRQKATVKVRIAFDALDPRILPDMGIKVAFLGEAPGTGVVAAARAVIPKAAVRDEGGKPVVYVLREGKLERRVVTVGATRGEDVDVVAGVLEGEQVVVAAPEGLKDGRSAGIKR